MVVRHHLIKGLSIWGYKYGSHSYSYLQPQVSYLQPYLLSPMNLQAGHEEPLKQGLGFRVGGFFFRV